MTVSSQRSVVITAAVAAVLSSAFTALLMPGGHEAGAAPAAVEPAGVAFQRSAPLRDPYIPTTEALGPGEMRVIALGTGMPEANKGQAAASFLVQLGNGDNFIFDIGTHAFANLTSLQVPWNAHDKVFLGHLHFDHIGDLSALLISGVSHGRNVPLRIWGPSGATPELGTRHAVEQMVQAFNWEFTSKRGKVPGAGYEAIVTEFDYSRVQVVYEQNGVRIRSWPAVHAIDGPVSYSLEWNGLKFVYSSDTSPNKWFIENAQGADLLVYETFPTVQQLISDYRMLPETAWPVGTRVHTQPSAAGRIFQQLRPRMAVAYHFISTPRTRQEILEQIRSTYDGPLTMGEDLLVWNVTRESLMVRQAVVPGIVWPSKDKEQNVVLDPSRRVFNSAWLEAGRLEMPEVDETTWNQLDPDSRARISEKLPGVGRAPARP